MSISSIIAYGFGSWGSVNELPTLGFGIGSSDVQIDNVSDKRLAMANGRAALKRFHYPTPQTSDRFHYPAPQSIETRSSIRR